MSDRNQQKRRRPGEDQRGRARQLVCSTLFWFFLWFLLSALLRQELILPTPGQVGRSLASVFTDPAFRSTLFFSLSHILGGFFLGFFSGILLAVSASRHPLLDYLLSPLLGFIKAAPLASYVILLLMVTANTRISLLIAFIVVLPLTYTNLLEGLKRLDPSLEELAEVYELPGWKRVKYIHYPQLLPCLLSSIEMGMGMSWKAGVAAELIGLPDPSIGSSLYQAKVLLDMSQVWAWTFLLVVLSSLAEKGLVYACKKYAARLSR